MISDVYYPRVNGVSTSIETFARGLLQQGHKITLIAPDYGVEWESPLNVIRIAARKIVLDPEDRLMSLRAIRRLAPQLATLQIDLIHIQTPFVAHYAGLFLAKQLGVKTLVSYHTFFEAYFEKYLPLLPPALLRGIARRFSRTQCNDVDVVISPSRPMRQKLREYGVKSPIFVIPTGLPLARFKAPEDTTFRARHGIDEGALLLLYVGRVAYEKNIDFLIRMFAHVCAQYPDACLLIAGEGPAEHKLRKQAARSPYARAIKFLGYLERDTELMACYHTSDLFVFASETETQGLVLLEAMACGLPVVSVASMGSKDVLRDGEGCVVAPLDEHRFAHHVRALLAHPERRSALATVALDYVKDWSADAKTAELADLYQKLLASPVAESATASPDKPETPEP